MEERSAEGYEIVRNHIQIRKFSELKAGGSWANGNESIRHAHSGLSPL